MSLPIARSASGLALGCKSFIRCKPRPLSRLLSCSYSTPAPSRHDRPFRMAVVGSGPAGFYTAYRVMSLIDRAKVDMYEALPVPFGLVRFGVAPDHPEVKVPFHFLSLPFTRLLAVHSPTPVMRQSFTHHCTELSRQVLRGCFLSQLHIRRQCVYWPQAFPPRRPISPPDHTNAPLRCRAIRVRRSQG